MLAVLGLLAVLLTGTAVHATEPVDHYWVFKTNASIVYTHMSTIEVIPDQNNLLVAAFQASGIGEGHSDQAILFTSSTDMGKTWAAPQAILNETYAVWGPAFHYDSATKTLFLYHSVSTEFNTRGPGRNYPGGNIRVVSSTDAGASWSSPKVLLPFTTGRISHVTANKPIVINKSRWLLPYWSEAHTNNDTGPPGSSVLVSDDAGATWAPYGCVQSSKTWLIENSVVSTKDGYLAMFFRTQVGRIWWANSSDAGQTWGAATATDLLNPDSKTMAITRPDTGDVIMAFNPSTTGRTPLDLTQSTTSGKSWQSDFAVLDSGADGSFSYPTPLVIGSKVFTTWSSSTSDGIKLGICDLP